MVLNYQVNHRKGPDYMSITSRSYLTAGIAALGIGAIALAPVQPVPALDQDRVTRSLAAALAAESTPIDPITPWVDTFETSIANIGKLFDFYASNPGGYTSPLGLEGDFQAVFPLLQTVIANQMTYLNWLSNPDIDDPLAAITGQIFQNIQTFFNAPWSPGDPAGEYISETVLTTALGGLVPINQSLIFNVLPDALGFTPEEWAASPLKPIVDFTGSYYSGQVVGLLGPLFAPLVELTRSFTAIGQFFEDGDVSGAINELINIPANVTNAVLNGGGFLDLTGVVNAIQPLPDTVKSIGLNVGGLISPPVPQNGTLVPFPDLEAPDVFDGGVFFDSIAAEVEFKLNPNLPASTITDPGIPVSWVGAAVGLGQFLGDAMVAPETPPAPPAPPSEGAAVVPVAADLEVEVEVEAAADEAPADEAPADELKIDELKIDDVMAEDEAPAPKAAAAVDAPAPSKATAGDDPAPKPAASVGSDDAGDDNDAD